MLDVLVNQINFDNDLTKLPDPQDLLIKVTFSNLLLLYLDPNEFPETLNKKNERCWGFNIGKSCIFSYNPQSLRTELTKYSLEIFLKNRNKNILGKGVLPWKKEFSDMVNVFEQIGVVKSVDHSNTVEIMDASTNKKIANLNLFIRMGCGGDGVETDFRLTKELDNDDWILIHTKTLASILCEGYTPENDQIIPIARLYNSTLNPPHSEATNLSWVETPKMGKKSDEMDIMELFAGNSAFDVISVCFTPNTNFFDFLTPEGTKRSRKSLKSKEEEEEKFQLTVKDICEQLCPHANCPGVKKFEDLGIRNSTTRKNNAGLAPSNKLFLTHVDQNLERYTPESIYMTPKNPNLPFEVPRKSAESGRLSSHFSSKKHQM